MFLDILVWVFLIGFFMLAGYVVDDTDITTTKVYKDLNETMLNRKENI